MDIRRRRDLTAVTIFLDIPDNNKCLLEHEDRKAALSRCILRQIVERKLLANQECAFMDSIQSGSVDAASLSLASIEKLIALETADQASISVIFDGLADDQVLTELHNELHNIDGVKFNALSIEPSARFPDVLRDDCDSCEAQGIDVFWRCKDCPESDETYAYFCKQCLDIGGKCAVDE